MTSFAEITGLLDRAQNPDALLTDGARALTGNLSVADGITIDGVDISAFQSAYQAHLANPVAHSYVRNILDDASAAVDRGALTNDVRIYGADGISVTKTSTGLRISGSGGGGGGGTFAGIKDPSGAAAVPDGFNYISLTVSNQVSITASTNALAFALVPGNINHQDLGGRGADDHHAAFVGLKVGATTINPDGSDVITIAAGTNATVVAGSNTVTIGVSSTPAFTSVTVSGNISVSGTVDGVDISTHAANANAHHERQHGLDGSDHTGTLSWSKVSKSGSNLADLATRAHSSLTGIGANDHHNQGHVLATNAGLGADHMISGATAGHVLRASSATAAAFAAIQDGDLPSTIVRTSRQIASGNGLTGGGNLSADRTLAVGAGAGITVNGDDVALTTPGSLSDTSTNSSSGNHTHSIDSTIARSAITISAGNGLSGGGNLTANRTLAVNQDYDFNWTGLHTFGEHTEMESVDVNGALTVLGDLSVFHGGFYPLYVNVDTVNPNNSNVGIMTSTPDPQFALDVAGPLRAQYLIGPHAIQLSDAAMIAHYDGPYPFETNFDGSAVGHLGQVATTTGGVIYRPGKFGKAVQLAESTTNLVANPSFETNTTGWVLWLTSTIERVLTEFYYGAYSLRVTPSASSTSGAYTTFSATANTFTVSIGFKGVKENRYRLFVTNTSAVTIGTSTEFIATGEWQNVSYTYTDSASATRRVYITKASVANTDPFYIDAVQVEQKAYATPYCDGSLGTGHTWSGTAHASTSSRTAAQIQYNIDTPDSFTVAGWFKYSQIKESFYTLALFNSLSVTNNRLIFGYRNAGAVESLFNYAQFGGGSSVSTFSNPATITPGAWVHLAVTFSNGTLSAYQNGVLLTSATNANVKINPSERPNRLRIGGAFQVWETGGVDVDDLVILSRAADAAEIRAIYESNAPVFAESSIEVWRTPTAIPIWVDSEGMWMRAVGGGETLGAYGGAATKSWGGKTLYQSDFLLGNATNGYIHWHAFQNPADPWGAAGMEIKAQVDITGDSTISGTLIIDSGALAVENSGGTVTYFLVTPNAMFVGGNINTSRSISAFFANDQDLPGAGPGGEQFDIGDLVIGEPTATNILWDQSAGRLNFRNGATVEAYVDDGAIVAGLTRMDSGGLGIATTGAYSVGLNQVYFYEISSGEVGGQLYGVQSGTSPSLRYGVALEALDPNSTGLGGSAIQARSSGGTIVASVSARVDGDVYIEASDDIILYSDTQASGELRMNATNKAIVLNRLTTTQRNAMGAENGMIIYNSTDGKVQARAGGSWVDLH